MADCIRAFQKIIPSVCPVKRMHCSLSFKRDISTGKYFLYSQKNNFNIQPHRQVIHIPNIQFEFLCPRDIVPPVDLCPTRNSRTDLMSSGLFLGIQRKILWQKRPRSDYGHVAFEHIPQLWQLVY